MGIEAFLVPLQKKRAAAGAAGGMQQMQNVARINQAAAPPLQLLLHPSPPWHSLPSTRQVPITAR